VDGEEARRIFSRIVNIPAHPGMTAIETADLRQALQRIARAGKH
jgi:dTDP-4-amino-4,6-dideoxygalactose transaminase